MTGEECLIQAMIEDYGMSETSAKNAVNTKNAQRIIETLAKNGGLLEKVALENFKRKEEALERETYALECARTNFYVKEVYSERSKLSIEKETHKKELERLKDLDEREKRLNELQEKLMSFESPEWRDRVRALELFDEKVGRLETAQNRTAYIASMGAIMSGVPVWSFSAKEKSTEEEPQPKASRRI